MGVDCFEDIGFLFFPEVAVDDACVPSLEVLVFNDWVGGMVDVGYEYAGREVGVEVVDFLRLAFYHLSQIKLLSVDIPSASGDFAAFERAADVLEWLDIGVVELLIPISRGGYAVAPFVEVVFEFLEVAGFLAMVLCVVDCL